MKIINFAEQNTIINQYLAEMRDVDYQKNRLLFRNNIERIGECEAFEISKTLHYETKQVTTPLGVATVSVPNDNIVLATIFRAGLPFHSGFLKIFDHAGNGFVSAFREYTDDSHTNVGIHVEYLATPDIEGKTDPGRPHAGHWRINGDGLQGPHLERHAQTRARGVRDSSSRGH